MAVLMRMAEAREPHRHQLDEEEHKDSHESDALRPWVLGDDARQALVAKCLIGRRKQLQRTIISMSLERPILESTLTCMNAVAMITPEPKYLATKKAQLGIPTLWCLAAKTGNLEEHSKLVQGAHEYLLVKYCHA